MNFPSGFRSKSEPDIVWCSRAAFPGWLLVAGLVVVLSSYFLYMPQQHQVESRFGQMVVQQLKYFPLENPDIPLTNLLQVLRTHKRNYPHDWHEWFRNYGDSAGFTHSLGEKYVFAPPGVDFRGEVYLLSAQTFRRGRHPLRTIITRHQDGFSYAEVGERFVQEAFQKAGKTIPEPPVAATPPPPPDDLQRNARAYYLSTWLETRGQFSKLEWHGKNPRTARLWERIVFGGILLIALGVAAYCLCPVCLPREEGESNALLPMTTAGKLWALAGGTFAVLFFVPGIFLPSLGSDRGFGQLYFHLVLPYLSMVEMLSEGRRGDQRLFAFFMQIILYNLFLGYYWMKNRLGFAALILALIHIFAIALSVRMAMDRYG